VPFMSPSEFREVVLDHHRKALEGNVLHMNLSVSLKEVAARGRRVGTDNTGARVGGAGKVVFTSAATFFFNYNTLESVLLGCAVLVNLAGIMFESKVRRMCWLMFVCVCVCSCVCVRGCGPAAAFTPFIHWFHGCLCHCCLRCCSHCCVIYCAPGGLCAFAATAAGANPAQLPHPA
jgi:hypothetical protein